MAISVQRHTRRRRQRRSRRLWGQPGGLSVLPYCAGALLSALALSGCGGDTVLASASTAQVYTIHVSGRGSTTVTPDMAETRVGVQTFAETADLAVSVNNELTEAVIAAIEAEGVQASDIQTSSFSVRPQRDYRGEEPPPIVGFWVDNTLSVRIRDLSTAGRVLQASIEAGANNVNGLTFTLSDPDPPVREARTRAIEDARAKAETLAAAAGVEVGKVMTIREMSGVIPVFFRAELDAAAGASVPVAPGELEVSAQVEVVFEIRYP